ncbi:MAG: adenylate/guanylate cyclase domain-containing protein, partial [Flavobacteriales bacterium]
MKQFRVLSIAKQKKTQKRVEAAGKLTPGITFSHVDTFEKAVDLLTNLEVGLIIVYDEFTQQATLDFMYALQARFRTREAHVWICSKNDRLANLSLEIYKAGVVDYLNSSTELSVIRTRFEVFRRLDFKRARIRELLENILPKSVAEELERKGKYPPRRHGLVTVLFTDFVRFTEKAEKIEPVELVRQLDAFYRNFDRIIIKFNLEKIKTIGDAYMCAGGVPVRNGFNPLSTVLAGLEIARFIEKAGRQNKFHHKPVWKARIGINSGDLVSGIVGDLKYSYDIWGETVNVAARMESSGEPGKVNISHPTYEHVKDYFNCTYRGEVEAKYMGKVKMYFVDSIRKEFTVGGNGITPTRELLQLAGIVRVDFEGAKKHIISRLKNEIPAELYYHGVHHTLDVVRAVEEIGKGEEIPVEDMLLLKTAAVFHDAGYLETYKNNEEHAVRMVRGTLPKFGYSTNQIRIICAIIRSTKQRAKPVNLLQKIMRDADYDYLGRKDYTSIAKLLY